MDLVGVLVGNTQYPTAGLSVTSGGGGPSREFLCRQACCAVPACTAYAYAPFIVSSPYNGIANCFLYANVTGLVPNTLMSSGVLLSAYS